MSIRGLQFLALVLLGSILALTGLRQFFVQPLENPLPNALWFGIQVLPLVLVLPGVLLMKARSFFFATLAAMLYFAHGILLAATPEHRTLGLWETGFSMALVLVATFTVRELQRRD
jgi:uncharacterized membrane protein